MKRPSPRRNRGSSRRFTAAPKNFAPMARPTGDYTPASPRVEAPGSCRNSGLRSFAISIDGCRAGPNQDLQKPLGVRGRADGLVFHDAYFGRCWRSDGGRVSTTTGGAGFAQHRACFWASIRSVEAVAGRKLEGWWGDEPPCHRHVLVLTHHPRAPLRMAGGRVSRRHIGRSRRRWSMRTAASGWPRRSPRRRRGRGSPVSARALIGGTIWPPQSCSAPGLS